MAIKRLLEIAKTPEPFKEGTHEIWLDQERADLVMKSHFDENIPGGSRGSDFINEAVDFIHNVAPVEKYKNIVDLGCGPGLYSQRLAKLGYEVVGIDFNKNAIDFAINAAKEENLSIEYRNEDFTSIELEQKFDIALLIYQIYGVFGPEKRKKILRNIHSGLKSEGLLLMDVLSEKSYENYEQKLMWWIADKGSPFSDKEHLVLYSSRKYPNKVTLASNVIAFGDGKLINYNYWNQHFSIEDLEKEVNESGFKLEKVYADVNGGEYSDELDSFAVLLRKK